MPNVRSIRPALTWQPTLLAASAAAPGIDRLFSACERVELEPGAWIDVVRNWVDRADALFDDIVERAPWTQRRVHMYERIVDEPRLLAWYDTPLDDPSLPPVVPHMAAALSARYDRAFDRVGAALYRDGRDSVAWHRDRIPADLVDPVVAIISLGSPRKLRFRSFGRRGASRVVELHGGDLLVTGGTTQRTWEHSVPKVAHSGPRISVQFRHSSGPTTSVSSSG